MIIVDSYTDVNGVKFKSSKASVISVFGDPVSLSINREHEEELHYLNFIIRFEAHLGEFREFTLLPNCLAKINGTLVCWNNSFFEWLKAEDGNLFEVFGFIVSLKLGIAVSGFHDEDDSQMAIHAFRRGDWDIFRKNTRPFKEFS